MEELFQYIESDFAHLILVTVFSLLIGLSQRHLHDNDTKTFAFGTDRTFTFIGIFGFIMLMIEPVQKLFFIVGAIIVTVFLAIHYFHKIKVLNEPGMTTVLVALLTYVQSAVLLSQPLYVYLFFIVIILIFSELKQKLGDFSKKFEKEEFLTLAKFIIMAGIVLPLLPDKSLVSYLSISPYKIWLAVVVISSISYISYLLRKFVFKDAGLLLTGILGGLYSSTATTVVLARKSKENPGQTNRITAAILLAIAMMYLRIAILVFVFNNELARILTPYLAVLFLFSALSGFGLYYRVGTNENDKKLDFAPSKHPLEFNVALLFTALYILFTFVNYFAIKQWGTEGLHYLAVIVGVADIDPFLLNLFQGKYQIAPSIIASASLLAIVSNNFLKMFYALLLYKKGYYKWLIVGFLSITILNILFVVIV
jgi:uncharacterized membrane protein (DUF4010 family)